MSSASNTITTTATVIGNLSAQLQGEHLLVTLPTGQGPCRAIVAGFCINAGERALAAMPSRDITVSLPADTNLREWCAKIIRQEDEGYFSALLVQSRGEVKGTPCAHRCGSPTGALPFLDCRTVTGMHSGACGSCIWQSHGSHCEHRS